MAVWSGYSTREAAEVVGLPESTVRSCVRAGVLMPVASGIALRFGFRDLAILKVVKQLIAQGIPLRRVRRQLTELRARLPEDVSLTGLTISAEGGHVVVRDGERVWRADTGQMVIPFERTGPQAAREPAAVAEMPVRRQAAAPEPAPALSADDWFERAVELEEHDTARAIAAYKRSLRLRPDCSETWINLGRLYAESGETERGAECFQKALELDPADPTALYNLGVVAQDAARDAEAVEYYRRALALDGSLAEAHYNLATLFDRTGDPQAAIRHINEYRKLTREMR